MQRGKAPEFTARDQKQIRQESAEISIRSIIVKLSGGAVYVNLTLLSWFLCINPIDLNDNGPLEVGLAKRAKR